MHNCAQAASYLRRYDNVVVFYNSITVRSNLKPAGCYNLDGWAYFNTNLDPASTINQRFGDASGICSNESNS